MRILETKSGYKIIPVLGGRSNVFLVAANKQCILIDTSVRSKWNKLEEKLNEINRVVVEREYNKRNMASH